MNKKIGIIGHFGGNKEFFDGQTIKTKELYAELKRSTNWNLIKVDTFFKSKNPLKLLVDTIKCIFTCKDIIILLSSNGLRVFLPILYYCSKYFKKRIYHDVIGGNDGELIEKYPQWVKYLNSFVVNWVESKEVVKLLMEKGINNVEYLPNFKRLKIIDSNMITRYNGAPYKFCTFSRISKEKGIPAAIEAIEMINKRYDSQIAVLDIYGAIDKGYEEEFYHLLENSTDAIQYKGIVNYQESTETLKNYFALLFPTNFYGEGFPGTILDAFSSGLPVIATDWHANSEIICNGVNGIIYPNNSIKTLEEAVDWAIRNHDVIESMREQCVNEASKYKPEKIVGQIISKINSYT